MRINKYISETGICSRREADKWVGAGRVTINGVQAELGSQAEASDEVRVDGRLISEKKPPVYIVLNKPVGITSTTEKHIKGNIVDFVGHPERIFPIGRLDKDSEGLILLTNDGDIVNLILRAENEHDKEYIVTVDKPVTESFLHGMAHGVRILGTVTQPCQVERLNDRSNGRTNVQANGRLDVRTSGRVNVRTKVGANVPKSERDCVFRMVLTQGLNRQIRRMCSAFGYQVRRLQRVRIMDITLDGLPVGDWRELTPLEQKQLFERLSYPG